MASKRGRGRPRKGQEAQTVDTDELVLACIGVGGTFAEAAAEIGVDRKAIFHKMLRDPAFNERVQRARAQGTEFRKVMLEDSLHVAVNMIITDPRYTVLAIFLSKAQLKYTDIPEDVRKNATGDLASVLREIVERKRQMALSAVLPQNNGHEYSSVPVKGTVTIEAPNHKANPLSRNTTES